MPALWVPVLFIPGAFGTARGRQGCTQTGPAGKWVTSSLSRHNREAFLQSSAIALTSFSPPKKCWFFFHPNGTIQCAILIPFYLRLHSPQPKDTNTVWIWHICICTHRHFRYLCMWLFLRKDESWVSLPVKKSPYFTAAGIHPMSSHRTLLLHSIIQVCPSSFSHCTGVRTWLSLTDSGALCPFKGYREKCSHKRPAYCLRISIMKSN